MVIFYLCLVTTSQYSLSFGYKIDNRANFQTLVKGQKPKAHYYSY